MPEAAKKLKRKSEARIRLLSQPPLDWPLAIIVLTLVVFGLVMLFSASSVSYTHLDVYKRQPLHHCGRGAGGTDRGHCG